MPRTNNRTNVQQYGVQVGVKNTRISPNTPARNFLYMRNKGANACEVRFGNECVGDIHSYDLQPGNDLPFPDNVPVNAINLRCSADGGTVIVIIEGKDLSNG